MSKKNVTITLTRGQADNLLYMVRMSICSYNNDKYDRSLYQMDKRLEKRIVKAIEESEAEG